jgi:hypothetical protein
MRIVWSMFAAALAACAGTGAGGRPAMVGVVVGPEGTALPDVRVETEPPTDRVLTGRGGRFEITRVMPGSAPLPDGNYRILLIKDGFLQPEPALLAELRGRTVDLGTVKMPSDDGLRVAPVDVAGETDAGDAAEAGGEVGRGL